jgi:predicted membrane protein
MPRSNGRLVVGLIVIAFGVIALLNSIGIDFVSTTYFFNLLWPILLVVIGINFITRKNPASLITGAVLIGCGVVFLGRNTGIFNVNMTSFWQGFGPVIIILIGINIIYRGHSSGTGSVAIMGAVDKTRDAWDLSSGEYTAIMGGIELDVRKANFLEREVTLNLNAIMGGITIIIPENIAVTCHGTAILGGVDLLGKGSGGVIGNAEMASGDLQTAEYILHLKCSCIMGGIEIKR